MVKCSLCRDSAWQSAFMRTANYVILPKGLPVVLQRHLKLATFNIQSFIFRMQRAGNKCSKSQLSVAVISVGMEDYGKLTIQIYRLIFVRRRAIIVDK